MALPERLARKAAAKVYLNPENEPAFDIAAEAVRAALDEAAKVARAREPAVCRLCQTTILHVGPCEKNYGIADAIEALKGEMS